MLKITVVEDRRRRQVVAEGKLIAPWTAELTKAYQAARTDLQGRELIVDLRGLTAISPEGEAILLQMMREKVKLVSGVYMREVLRQLELNARDGVPGSTSESTIRNGRRHNDEDSVSRSR